MLTGSKSTIPVIQKGLLRSLQTALSLSYLVYASSMRCLTLTCLGPNALIRRHGTTPSIIPPVPPAFAFPKPATDGLRLYTCTAERRLLFSMRPTVAGIAVSGSGLFEPGARTPNPKAHQQLSNVQSQSAK